MTATQSIPQGDGAGRALPVHLQRSTVTIAADRPTMTLVGDLLRALDREVLRDVLPAFERLTAAAGVRLNPEDWTGGRARFADPDDRAKAWKRLSGLMAIAIANAESLDARVHWRVASSFLRYLALLEYQNAVTALNNKEKLELSIEQVVTLHSDALYFGEYAGVL